MTPTPDRQEIEDLKARVDLVALLQEHGVDVRKQGRSFKALCPFHVEQTPSLSIDRSKGVYHCFGCGKSGDHLAFLQEHGKLAFGEALTELRRMAVSLPSVPTPPSPHPLDHEPFPYDLMARVAEVWQQVLAEQPEGLTYLESRGIRDKSLLGQVQAGYCDGDKLLAITTAAERELLLRAGVINEGGKEFFSRCVVFPLKDRQNRVVGFYGRSTLPRAKVPHRFCGPTQTGLFCVEAARGVSNVFLVEGILDALALMQSGFPNVMPMGGAQGFSPALLSHLTEEKVKELVLCLDGDEAGQQGAAALQSRLEKEGFAVRTVTLPEGQDPLSFATRVSSAELKASLFPASSGQVTRKYRKLSMAQGKLKVFVSLTNAEGVKADTTVDLFSTRSRQTEAAQLARRLGVESGLLEEWFLQVLQEIEEMRQGDENAQELFAKVEVPPMSEEQRKVALQFLTQKNLVEAILQDMEALGYVGEEEAKLLGYCVSVSRKLERPMSAIIQSGSGAGKSYLAEVIRTLTPPEDVVFYSRLSPQALYHMPQDYLVHKLLELEERVGGESCDYQIRSLQSAGILRQVIVMKDPNTGQLMVRENEVWGPIAYMETTTSLRLNPENTSRCFEIPLDESPEQTARIHERQKALRSLQRLTASDTRERIQERHHHAQRLLEPIPVVIPYVDKLTFPTQWLRSRRDHDRFLTLIEVIAYLHQHQRPRKVFQGVEYIEATVADYRWAYFLAHKVLRNSLDEVSRWAREMLTFFETENPVWPTRRELRERLQWPPRRVRDVVDELLELEYLEARTGPNNQHSFQLVPSSSGSPFVAGILHPDELESLWP
jgi:DNA primase